jgi:hypothetical protein
MQSVSAGVLATVALNLAGCAAWNASGKVDYAGKTVLGAFERSATVEYCRARLTSGPDVAGMFILNPHRFFFGYTRGSILFDGPVERPRGSVIRSSAPSSDDRPVEEPPASRETIGFGAESGVFRQVSREQCSVFDVRRWMDERKQLHVSIHLDCTSDDVHVQGTAISDDCDYLAP